MPPKEGKGRLASIGCRPLAALCKQSTHAARPPRSETFAGALEIPVRLLEFSWKCRACTVEIPGRPSPRDAVLNGSLPVRRPCDSSRAAPRHYAVDSAPHGSPSDWLLCVSHAAFERQLGLWHPDQLPCRAVVDEQDAARHQLEHFKECARRLRDEIPISRSFHQLPDQTDRYPIRGIAESERKAPFAVPRLG